jgi:alginate O-acetyltransferase complex protein AlgI
MLFTSLEFFVFLPLVLLVFAKLPIAQRWIWLLLASYVFYGIWQPFNLVYLGAVTLVVYACGLGMQGTPDGRRRAAFLTLGLIAVLGSLFAFKFYDFIAGELERLIPQTAGGEASFPLPRIGVTMPVGYSFYAFSAASYLIDIYVRRLPEKQNAGHVALYVAYFPKIFAGPIERATTFLPQVWNGMRADPDRFVLGLQLIGWGLFKKLVIADNLAPLVDRNFGIAAFAPPMELLISRLFLRVPDLLRFLGLHRHRHRHFAPVRHSADGEFPAAVSVA